MSYQPVARDEKVIGPSFTGAADNCTEMHVVPASSWVNYAPNEDFMSTHGHYTVSLNFSTAPIHHKVGTSLRGVNSPEMMRTALVTCKEHVLASLN